MAVTVPSALISQIRNAIGDVVLYPSHGRQFVRARVSPLNTITAARTRVRANLTTSATAWKSTLTQAQRAKWNDRSATAWANPHRYQKAKRSGWQFFHQVNLVRLNLGLSILTDPPTGQNMDPPTNPSVDTLDAPTQSIKVNCDGANGPNTHILIYASGNEQPGHLSPNGTTRFIQAFAPGAPRPFDISAAWAARYGIIQAGHRVNFQIASANALDGRMSPRAYATALVAGENLSLLGVITPNPLSPPDPSTWVWHNQLGVVTYINQGGAVAFILNTATGTYQIASLVKPLPVGWAQLAVGCLGSPHGTTDQWLGGAVLRESATGKSILWGLSKSTGTMQWRIVYYAGTNLFQSNSVQTSTSIFGDAPFMWAMAQPSGTNLVFGYSPDGQQFIPITTQAKNAFFTTGPDEYGVGIDQHDAETVTFIHALAA